MTMKQAIKEANNAPKFVMHTNEFGSDLFIADTSKTPNGLQITDRISEAQLWSDGFDNTKIEYWKALTGYNLKIKLV
jgi:hypothetical protein